MNCDVLTDLPLTEMILFHEINKPLATLATTTRESSRYFLFNRENMLCGWENVKTGEKKIIMKETALQSRAFSGIHIINKKIFSLMGQTEIKFSMVDVYLSLCAEHKILSFDHSATKFIDVGKPESLEAAKKMFIN
jgi:NDP-sugar pyrophosphorylase family protein